MTQQLYSSSCTVDRAGLWVWTMQIWKVGLWNTLIQGINRMHCPHVAPRGHGV